jgi:GT2 family glycosyltransferase
MPTTTSDRVRVVIVNYRSEDDVALRLASPALSDADVIVVDNGSDPERVRELCKRHGATAVLLPENVGFAAGVNAAWREIDGRRPLPLLLLNPDAELTCEALETLLGALPGHDGVGPLLLEAPGQPQVGAGGGPITLWSVVTYFLMLSHVVRKAKGLFLTRAQSRKGGRVSWICMASLLLAPDALDRFGVLPEDELVYAEDVAWGTAATVSGARFALVPQAIVLHPHGASGASDRWIGALERLLHHRLGRVRGGVAVLTVRLGLSLRRVIR